MDLADLTEPALGLSQIPGMDTGVNDTQVCEGSDEEASGAAADAVKVVSDAEHGGVGDAADESEDDLGIPALVDEIARRLETDQIPAVLPSHLKTPSEQEEAVLGMQLVLQLEATEVQSFHDAAWREYIRDNPCDEEGLSMPMRRARWSRQTYYPLTRNFLLKSAFGTGRFAQHMAGDLFVPMEVVKAEHEHAREWSAQMTGKSLSVFNSSLEQRRQELQNQSQRRGGVDLARFQMFVEEEY